MVSLASMLGNGMDERVSSFLVRRFAEAVVEDERMEKASYAAQYLDSFIS